MHKRHYYGHDEDRHEGRGHHHGPPWTRHDEEHDMPPWARRRMAFWMARKGRGPFGGGPFGGGPFGDDPFGGDGGPRRRHRRGDIKFALLELLAEQPRHGYDLIKELESRYAGFYRPSPGTVYPTLQLLADEGHLTSEQAEGKRIYTITESGRLLLAERQGGGEGQHGFRHDEGGEGLDGLRRSARALIEVVMQSARHGTPEQVQAVGKVIDGARREVYRILADSPE
ncbi:PadR family transcriptional regulator [Oscillochloris sp. ZM17-4]|uniref:PadR family transcriptional regulator n=1 Tax=Oscillochloris sp. ZM17-4 TaxID=2866714 RepID=UPI001C73ABBD|nr:PadR family transcriptional regulator [Oscillochloris sp. ZM17-4]MBX0329181.1 PadR family transcriptional regulator [Oscillochloris sp. ZM17-4]